MFDTILGLACIYSIIHFFVLQGKAYKDRTNYEKGVTISAYISFVLFFIGIIMML